MGPCGKRCALAKAPGGTSHDAGVSRPAATTSAGQAPGDVSKENDEPKTFYPANSAPLVPTPSAYWSSFDEMMSDSAGVELFTVIKKFSVR